MAASGDSCNPSFLRFTANTTRFYELLELDKGASAQEVKRAYKKQAVRHHPDKGGNPEHFREIVHAYEVLSDPVTRAKYDEFGEVGLEPGWGCQEPPAACEPKEDDNGRLTVGACALATAASAFCGVSTAAGVALCGVGRVLSDSGRRQVALAATMLGGWLLLWPWVGLPSVIWTAAMYGATLAGLGVLAAKRDHLPGFLPYLLFAGYFLLFLLVPARSAERVLVELPGYVVITDSGEVESDCALAEGAALFTWGMVVVHEILTRTGSPGARKRDEPSAV